MVLFFMLGGKRDASVVIASLLNRLFLGQISTFYWWQHYIDMHGYLWGATFPNPHHIFPFDSVPITKLVEASSPENVVGVVGSMPSLYWAEGYANFGVLGVVLFSMIFAIMVGLVDAFFLKALLRTGIAPVVIGYYVLVIMLLKNYATGLLSTALFDPSWMLLVMVALWVRLSCSKVISYNLRSRNHG